MEITRSDEKCNSCLLCIRDCVSGVWRPVDGVPQPVHPELCNACGHCRAVCPTGAIRHSLLDDTGVRRVDRKLLKSEVYAEIVASRRSVRQYKDDPVPPEIIDAIIDLARYSPTASNTQNVEYTVVTDRRVLAQVSAQVFGFGVRLFKLARSPVGRMLLSVFRNTGIVRTLNRYLRTMDYYVAETAQGRDYILHNAPVLILVSTPKGAAFGPDNGNIAGANIINYAHALGLGSCYIGFLVLMLKRNRKLRRMLRLAPDRTVQVALVLGYPAYVHSFTAYRKKPVVHKVV